MSRGDAIAAALIAVVIVGAPGCERREADPPANAKADSVQKHVYTVRGVVAQVPDPTDPRTEFKVRHEAIPHFLGQGGELGMDTMTMPFPLATGLSLAGLAAGDTIELTFEVDYDSSAQKLIDYRATAFKALPPGTALDFSALRK